jgi:low temperature requirement protein LtrA
MSTTARHPRIQAVSEDARVTPIELFFDLVFVFSLTQVTALMAHDPTVHGLIRGLLVLCLLWWCWVGFAWLGNVLRADEGVGRVAMFGAMASMFVLALTVPEAFSDMLGGLPGPVVLAIAYLAVRLLHLAIFWLAGAHDPGLRRQLLRFLPSLLGSTVLLLVASQLEGTAQTITWVAVVVADYAGTMLAGASGWRLNSASHFAERHGLIVIIALGESIVATGGGVATLPISWPIIAASTVGLTLAACLWWAYFDVLAIAAERVLREAQGEERVRLARDAYSYLHLPMIAGIVLVALGMENVLEYVGDATQHALSDPLALLPLGAMYGGVALYLLAQVGFKYRNWHTLSSPRLIAFAVILLLIPAAMQIPALGALGVVTVVMAALIAFESMTYSDLREQVRHEGGLAAGELHAEQS